MQKIIQLCAARAIVNYITLLISCRNLSVILVLRGFIIWPIMDNIFAESRSWSVTFYIPQHKALGVRRAAMLSMLMPVLTPPILENLQQFHPWPSYLCVSNSYRQTAGCPKK
jgi:hypothetical protein